MSCLMQVKGARILGIVKFAQILELKLCWDVAFKLTDLYIHGDGDAKVSSEICRLAGITSSPLRCPEY